MSALKNLVLATAVALPAAGVPFAAHAQTSASASTAAASEMAEAEVRRVDKGNKKITLKHGPIKNLDMPPMTMVFNVNDAALLDKVQAGDKVRFSATSEGGRYTVTDLQPAK